MTEDEWSTCTDPDVMLSYRRTSWLAGDRKLRLFACACFRHVPRWMRDERNRQAVELSERFADGLDNGKGKDLAAARERTRGTIAEWIVQPKGGIGVRSLRAKAARAARDRHAERLYHCALFRDILWWFTPRGFDSSWRTPAVWSLAREIYQERAFERMTELAESLQAAGCTNPRILAHCRQASPHVRGCWLLDLILGMPPPPGAGPFSDRYSYFETHGFYDEWMRRFATDRMRRLWACANCRRAWHLLPEASRQALEVAEQFADHQVSDARRRAARGKAFVTRPLPPTVLFPMPGLSLGAPEQIAKHAVSLALAREPNKHGVIETALAWDAVPAALKSRERHVPWSPTEEEARFRWETSTLFRDMIGNPFRPVVLDSSWLTSEVVALCEAIYAGRAFERMPELADALEQAGCRDRQILSHCRWPDPHVRGCWVLDLLLGKD